MLIPRTTDTPPETSAVAYLLNDKGEVQKADVGSDLYNEARNYGKLFVITKPSQTGDFVEISIPYPLLEAVAQSELPELLKTIQKLSGSVAGKDKVLFEVTGIGRDKAAKTTEKLLIQLAEHLLVKKPERKFARAR